MTYRQLPSGIDKPTNRRRDTQHNDIKHNGIKHNGIKHNGIKHNGIKHKKLYLQHSAKMAHNITKF